MPRLGYLCGRRRGVPRAARRAHGARPQTRLEIKRKMLEQFTESNLYPYTQLLPARRAGALRPVLEEPLLHDRPGRPERGLREPPGHEHRIARRGSSSPCASWTSCGRSCVAFQEETGNNYNLEATPAEGTSYRLARIDAEKFPGIVSGNDDIRASRRKPFYTNSSQLPVQYSDDIFEVLDLQDELQTKYTGGTVVHLFVGEEIADPGSVKKLVKLDLRALPPALLHHHPDLQHLPVPRLPLREAGDLPALRRRLRGLLAGRRLPAAGEPVERGQGGGVQAAEDVQDRRRNARGPGLRRRRRPPDPPGDARGHSDSRRSSMEPPTVSSPTTMSPPRMLFLRSAEHSARSAGTPTFALDRAASRR